MNQTNFGFNPARQTIVNASNTGTATGHPQRGDNMMQIEPMNRRELNT